MIKKRKKKAELNSSVPMLIYREIHCTFRCYLIVIILSKYCQHHKITEDASQVHSGRSVNYNEKIKIKKKKQLNAAALQSQIF